MTTAIVGLVKSLKELFIKLKRRTIFFLKVECPSHLFIYNSSKQFSVRIHPNELAEGKVYFTQIKAYDLDDPKMSCLFKIPITVVKPFT